MTKTEQLAEWTSAEINDFPDSSFAWIEDGGEKDEGGKTAPRSLRHLPFKDADGAVDAPHARNALARLPQVENMPEGVQERVRAILEKALEGTKDEETQEKPTEPPAEKEPEVPGEIDPEVPGEKEPEAKLAERFSFFAELGMPDGKSSWVEVLRTGVIRDRDLKITPRMLKEYVQHFKDNVYGTEIQVNMEHERGSEAQGWIKDLRIEESKDDPSEQSLMAQVEWTEPGRERVAKSLFKFVSAELANQYPHHETGKLFDNVFIGVALTNTPALKGQSPIALAEKEKSLTKKRMFKTMLAEYSKRDVVTAADKAMLKTMLAEVPAAEAAEMKTELDAVMAKTEASENLEEKAKIQELQEKNTLLEKTLAKNELTEVAKSMLLSAKQGHSGIATGFVGKGVVDKLVNFLIELTQEQRDAFTALVSHVQTVDLATKGVAGSIHLDETDDEALEDDEKVAKKAAAYMATGKFKTIEEAQKQAYKDVMGTGDGEKTEEAADKPEEKPADAKKE